MLTLIVASVRGHIIRFLLTVLSVTLGVTLVAGTYVLTDNIDATFETLIDTSSAGVDVQVRGAAGASIAGQLGSRQFLPIELQDQIAELPSVKSVRPDLTGNAIVMHKDGSALLSPGSPTLGYEYREDNPAYTLIAGRGPLAMNEVVLEKNTMIRSELKLQDPTTAVVGQITADVVVVGVVEYEASLFGSTMMFLSKDAAQFAFAPDGQVSSYTVTARPNADGIVNDEIRKAVQAEIKPLLTDGAEVLTGAELAEESSESVNRILGFVRTFLLVFAGVSLFVGGFIISNTFSMLVAQRTRELALLRALGSSQEQIVVLVLGEAALVAIIGSLTGFFAGTGLASGLRYVFQSQFDVELAPVASLQWDTVLASGTVGVVVTILAALGPAVRASRVPPIAAMRDDIAMDDDSLTWRGILGLLLMLGGIFGMRWGLLGEDVLWIPFAAGALALIIGTISASALVTRPIIGTIGALPAALSTISGTLARNNGLRNPRRTASTAAALMVGITLIATFSVVATSARASVSDVVAKQLTSDFVLYAGQRPFPHSVVESVSALESVSSVAPLGIVALEMQDGPPFAVASDARALSENVRIEVVQGDLFSLDDGKFVITEKEALNRGWEVGDVITMTIGGLKDQQVPLGAILADSPAFAGGGIAVPYELYAQGTPQGKRDDLIAYVKMKPGQDKDAVRVALEEAVSDYAIITVQDADEYIGFQAKQVNQILLLIYVFLALSILIAVLGIVNTLALSVFERTREIGLLRAVGLAKAQLARTIVWEAIATSIFGAVLGSTLGLTLGIALRYSLRSRGLTELIVPWNVLIVILLLAVIAGILAALMPALRAVRLNVLQAMSTDMR